MSAEKEIEYFLDSEFKTGLCGYFNENEKAERTIVKEANSFSVEEEPCGTGKRYHVTITVGNKPELRGQILRNRARIEANLLTAIRKLTLDSKPHWNASVIVKVTVIVQLDTSAISPTVSPAPGTSDVPGNSNDEVKTENGNVQEKTDGKPEQGSEEKKTKKADVDKIK